MFCGEPPLPLPPNLEAFKKLIASSGKRKGGPAQKFVKKVDIPYVELPADKTCRSALNLAEHGLIGKFTSRWPSPKAIDGWVQRKWRPLISDGIRNHFVGRGYYVFVFDSPEDRDLIFRNGPYFMDPRGLYLNKWTIDFDPTQDVPSAIPVWVKLPHLPLHCWNSSSLKAIGNKLGKCIDRAEPKDQFS